jgi:hypothetical protein
MRKALAIIMLLTFNGFISVSAQQNTNKKTIKIARSDVGRRFVLTKEEYKLYKKDKGNTTSDLFKPNSNTVSDTTLLADSVYVKAYRNFAYIKARSRADSRLIVIAGGTIIVACVAVAALIINDLSQIDLGFPK